MNAKRAKQLRRIAEARTLQLPDIGGQVDPHTGQVVNAIATTRGLYRNLKRTAGKP